MNITITLNEDFGNLFTVYEEIEDEPVICFTFYPDKNQFLHYHIYVNTEKVKELYKLLGDFIKENG